MKLKNYFPDFSSLRRTYMGAAVAFVAVAAIVALAPGQAQAAAATSTGSITVCNMIVGSDGTVATSSAGLPSGSFSVLIGYKANAAAATTTIDTINFTAGSFAPNTKIISSTDNDAECVTSSSTAFLALLSGVQESYIYEETITGSEWGTPLYNDQYSSLVTSTSTFFALSTTGDKNADGFIDIGTSTPDRTLVILNSVRTSTTTTPTTTPSTSGGNGGSSGGGRGGSSALRITDEEVEQVVPGIGMVTWKTNKNATSRVVYGTKSIDDSDIDEDDGNTNFGYENTTIELEDTLRSHGVAVGGLQPGSTYYFRPVSERGNEIEVGDEIAINPRGGSAQSCVYLNDYLKRGWNNNTAEVTKLQIFLREFEGHSSLRVTGTFDDATFAAVSAFQKKYASDILTPWGYAENQPTGFVYILTKKKINEIYCDQVFPLTPEQQTEIALFRNFLGSLKDHGITNGGTVIPPRSGSPAPYEGGTTTPVPGDNGGVIINEGEIGMATGTASTTVGTTTDVLDRGVLGNLAAAVFSLPATGTEMTRCIFNLVIILAIIYIVTSILVGGDDMALPKRRVRFRKIMFFIGGTVIALAFALFFDMFCLIVPLLVVLIALIIAVIWNKSKGDSTPTPGITGGGNGPAKPLIVEEPKPSTPASTVDTEKTETVTTA